MELEKRHRAEGQQNGTNWETVPNFEPSLIYILPENADVAAGAPSSRMEGAQPMFVRQSLSTFDASSTLDSLPALAVVTTRGAVHWLRAVCAGLLYARFDGDLCGDEYTVKAASEMCAVDFSQRIALSIQHSDGKYTVRIAESTSGRPLKKWEAPVAIGPITVSGNQIVCGASETNSVFVCEVAEDSVTLKRTVRLTPSPLHSVWSLNCNALVCLDSIGSVELARLDTVVPHTADRNGSISAVKWTAKSASCLYDLLKLGCKTVLSATVTSSGVLVVLFDNKAGSQCLWAGDVLGGTRVSFVTFSPMDLTLQGGTSDLWRASLAARAKFLAGRELLCALPASAIVCSGGRICDVDFKGGAVRTVFATQASEGGMALACPTEMQLFGAVPQAARNLIDSIDLNVYPELHHDSTVDRMLVAACSGTVNGLAVFHARPGNGAPAKLVAIPNRVAAPTDTADRPAAGPSAPTTAVVHTSHGVIRCELLPHEAPKAVRNFVSLATDGFYDGLTFHRVIKGFMIQGGCPRGDGTGGKSVFGGPFEDEVASGRRMEPFSVCMANAGPDTNQSQFFITCSATPWLQGKHTIFGCVIDGIDVVRAIESVSCGPSDRPLRPVTISKISIESAA